MQATVEKRLEVKTQEVEVTELVLRVPLEDAHKLSYGAYAVATFGDVSTACTTQRERDAIQGLCAKISMAIQNAKLA